MISARGTFYIDRSFAFTRLFLYGCELSLATFQLIVLLTIYFKFSNIVIAVVINLLLNKVNLNESKNL